jgi:hypothetical protein
MEYNRIKKDENRILALETDGVAGAVADAVAAAAALTVLTDNTGATPDSTIANVPAATAASTDTSAASLTSTNTALTAIENNISDLAAKVNALIAALDAS